MKVPFNDISRIHNPLRNQLNDAWNRVVDGNSFILGEEVGRFEDAFAKYSGFSNGDYVSGVSNGLNALTLILKALGIKEGDEVITQANTFVATAGAIRNVGALPVLVDVDSRTGLMDTSRLEEMFSPRTKAIMPVHLYGQQSEMETLVEIAEKRRIPVIEDAAQSHGSRRNGSPPGTLGIAAGFSFYPGKNLGAFGDAGAAISKDPDLIKKIKQIRNYGQTRKYHHDVEPLNERMDGLQAAVLGVKLPHLDSWNASRRESAEKLIEGLGGIDGVELPVTAESNTHTYHVFAIKVDNRESLAVHLEERGISTGIHYPVPIHLQPAFAYLGYKKGDFPVSENWSKTELSLPMFPNMKDEEITHIVQSVKSYFE